MLPDSEPEARAFQREASDAARRAQGEIRSIMREYLPLEGNNLDDALLPGASPRIKSASAARASAGARAKPAGAPPPAEEC